MGLGVVLRPPVKVSTLSTSGNVESYPNFNNPGASCVISGGADTYIPTFFSVKFIFLITAKF